uniref:F-box domain-containing protein n=1 Tax=Caenorhabditis tropicalis TaxID=1561998 RepID=A0A1I7ULI2_9PELO
MSANLLELPEVVMRKILKKLDFQSIQILRKVSISFRKAIDDLRPDSELHAAAIWITESGDIRVHYDPDYGEDIEICYKNHEEGCIVMTKNNGKVLVNEDYSERALEDFGLVIRNQKSVLKSFQIYRRHRKGNFDGFLDILRNNVLEKKKIRTRELEMECCNQRNILAVLPYLDPKEFLELRIRRVENECILEVSELAKLEIWKRLRVVSLENCFILAADIQYFTHFRRSQVIVKEVTPNDLLAMKKKLLQENPEFLEFHLHFETFLDRPKLFEAWGTPEEPGTTWYFKIPDSEFLIEVDFQENRVLFTRYPLKWFEGKRRIQ